MKKILFPTDFSENSNNAYLYALKFAENINAKVIILHVYQYPILESNYIDMPLYQAEVYQSLEWNDFENYKSHVPILRKIAENNNMEHIQTETILLDGDFVNTVLQTVKSENIDYIIMGTTGASGIKEFFLGSNAASVMTSTDAAVLAVPESSSYEPIRKICFTTQFNSDDFEALKEVVKVAKGFNATIDCLYVKTSDNDVDSVIIADWKLLFKDEKVTFHIVESDDVESTITDFIIMNGIDMLALLNHKRGFWESFFHTNITKKLAHHIKIPLLALHENKK